MLTSGGQTLCPPPAHATVPIKTLPPTQCAAQSGYFHLSYAAYHTIFTIPVAVGLALSQPVPLT